ncbi:hypothetical protein TWF696_007827 [Orbilia brochopaga]|uniref:Protein kinase domain-containing protein n=1 Tax=Orbilia brochopaga TaxID=3140254 RepID=A0AAV9UPR7_9PEZI
MAGKTGRFASQTARKGRTEAVQTQLKKPLPALNIVTNAHALYSSEWTRTESLKPECLVDWGDFLDDVEEFFSTRDLFQRVAINDSAVEHVIVGNETGVSGRVFANVGQPLGKAWSSCGIEGLQGLRFHDPQVDEKVRREPHNGPDFPDFIISDTSEVNASPRIVGEIKAPWRIQLKNVYEAPAIFVELLMGQLSRQMRLLNLKYGILTTYEYTIFVRRMGPYRYEMTPPIEYNARNPSVSQCFFYLGYLTTTTGYGFLEDESFDRTLLLGNDIDTIMRSTAPERKLPGEHPAETTLCLSRVTRNSILYGPDTLPTGIIECTKIIRKGCQGTVVLEGRWKDMDVVVKFWPDIPEDIYTNFYKEIPWALRAYNSWGYKNELAKYKELEGSPFIAELLDYGRVVLSNELEDGNLIILRKVPGEPFSNQMWENFSVEEQEAFRQQLSAAFKDFRDHHLVHKDATKDNVMWIKDERQVVILDLESVEPTQPEYPDDMEIKSILDMSVVI